jgi:hypothetical protein
MAKKVKLPGDSQGFEDLQDAELSPGEESPNDGGDAYGSEDVSDYEGQPKAAPRQAYFGADRCRIKFQLKGDQGSGVVRVCGGSKSDCSRKHHKQGDDRAPIGIYDTIITRACVDGILSTFRSRTEQETRDRAYRRVMDEATEELVGSAAYQAQLKGLSAEMGRYPEEEAPSGPPDQAGTPDTDGWSYTSKDDYENAKIPAVDDGVTPRGLRHKAEEGKRHNEVEQLATKVRGIEAAVIQMASAVNRLVEGQAAPQPRIRREDSSEDEVAPRPRGGSKRTGRLPKGKDKAQDTSRQYYAVARGRNPGVYTDWGSAEKQVNGFSGALYKKFKARSDAQRFVERHCNRPIKSSDDEDGNYGGHVPTDSDEDLEEEPLPQKTKTHPPRGGGEPRRSMDVFPPLAIAAPDPSTGNSKELFKMSLGSEEQMAAKLSPPGLDRRTMQELANATLDAIQLPGTSNTETADGTGELVGALREMASDRQYEWAEDRPQKDSLWRTAGRTSLLTIKTAEGLQERFGEFAGIPEEMFETQVHRFRTIFSNLHWSDEMIQAWSANNWFLRIGKDTLDHYVALHLHLFTLSNTEGWTYAHEALKYYGAKLLQFRRTNTSRLVCLLKIYIFLRDARKNDFYSAKLQEKRNHAMLAKISALETGGGKGGSDAHKCKKCGLDQHPGGVKKCWFRNLTDAEAKKRGAQLMTKLGKMSADDLNAFLGVSGGGGGE